MNNNISIYCNDNKYGYRYNLNNPKIRELYHRYLDYIGASKNFPLSDEERFEFEKYLDGAMKK